MKHLSGTHLVLVENLVLAEYWPTSDVAQSLFGLLDATGVPLQSEPPRACVDVRIRSRLEQL